MLETDPQIEGKLPITYSDDRGRPVVCKESTAHHHLDGPAESTHTQHSALHSTAQSPTPLSFFFHSPERLPCASEGS